MNKLKKGLVMLMVGVVAISGAVYVYNASPKGITVASVIQDGQPGG